MVECWKCEGEGILPQFSYIENGKCFACGGTGKLSEAQQSAITLESAGKFKRTGKMSHFALMEFMPDEEATNPEMIKRFNKLADKFGTDEVDDEIDKYDFKDLQAEVRDYLEVKRDSENASNSSPIDADFEALLQSSAFDVVGTNSAAVMDSDKTDQIKGFSNAFRGYELYINSNYNEQNTYAHDTLLGMIKHHADKLGHEIDSDDLESFRFKEKMEAIKEELAEDFGVNISDMQDEKLSAINSLSDYMENYLPIYKKGDVFALDDLPFDAGYGSNFSVLMPDGNTLDYEVYYDKEKGHVKPMFKDSLKIAPVTKRAKIGEKLNGISSKLNKSHVKAMGNLEYLFDNEEEITNTIRERGLKPSMDAFKTLNSQLLSPKLTPKERNDLYNKGRLALNLFTPTEMKFFHRIGDIEGRGETNEDRNTQVESFIRPWYSDGGYNLSTTMLGKTLLKHGLISGGEHDYLEDKFKRKYEGEDLESVMQQHRENVENAKVSKEFESAALKMYLLTQMRLKADNIDTITLYRGIKRSDASTYSPRNIESWSKDKTVAKVFSKNTSNSESNGSILTRQSPRENILFDFETFNLSYYENEAEYVYMSGSEDKDFTWEERGDN